jgi:coenzyme F420-0:L-glutamate ligase / coenzyme F420-1:gamma-L-glutamate ligase
MSGTVSIIPISDFPRVKPGDDLAGLLIASLQANSLAPQDGDIVVLAQKIVSKAEKRYVDLALITASERARELAAATDKDPRLVELILRESRRVVRQAPGVLVVEHRLGFIMANAGIDASNVDPAMGREPVLLLPENPDRSAALLRDRLRVAFSKNIGVIISDSFGRPWRLGTVGVAIGSAGLPALVDLRGQPDLYGRTLRATLVGFADEVAAAASLVMGQGAEGRPAILVRGLPHTTTEGSIADLVRKPEEDLFR